VEQLMRWTGVQVNRRKFLRNTLGGAFGLFAGLAIGHTPLAYAGSCTGPMGGGSCGALCTSYPCGGCCGFQCACVTGWCDPGTCCWFSGGHICCDCFCRPGSGSGLYCYCHWT
jgi:hypothetical protein